ncbi:hypothetical protein D3C72_1133490 [compost metagenome]
MSAWTDEAYGEAYANTATLLFQEIVTVGAAHISHPCCLCGRDIEPGRPYRRQVGMSRGDRAPWVLKEHLDCYAEAG